jgi:sulfite exporter TauE/SafE
MFIEDTLTALAGIGNVHVDIHTGLVTFDSEDRDQDGLLQILNKSMEGKRYVFTLEKKIEEKKENKDIWKALGIGGIFLVLFFLLQKSGVLNFGIGGGTTPVTSFLIGVIASLSSCLAIVGGLVLSFSAKIAEDDATNKKPLVLFHVGRIGGFALLGGVLGIVGGAIGINYIISGVLGLLSSLVMILLGCNLLGLFKKKSFTLPTSIFKFFRKLEHKTLAPLLLGVGTFFLPCGFTQSMQISALSSGSFVSGSLIMFSFVIGTFTVLALVSFGSMSFAQSKHAALFFKVAGVVVIGLGVFALLAGLAGLGIINPLIIL